MSAKAVKRTSTKKGAAAGLPSNTRSSDIPADFTQTPQSLQPFLDLLSPKYVYLLHLDTLPPENKREIFILPICLNLAIIVTILYRIYLGCYTYPDILASLFGQQTSASVDPSSSSWSFLSGILGRRTLNFLFDYLLVAVFLPWPIRFLFGPTQWRRKVGFQQTEVVVRKSRAWSEKLATRTWIRDDQDTMREKVIPAITPLRLAKTGYLLVDADWDLDYLAMIKAHDLLGNKSLSFDDFKTSVLVYGGEKVGWLIWRIGDKEESTHMSSSERDKILQFQEKLASMGKENLFFRWVELIQYESTQPGGFTPERQRKAMLETKQLFEEQGVDFEKFWEDVGGMQGVSI